MGVQSSMREQGSFCLGCGDLADATIDIRSVFYRLRKLLYKPFKPLHLPSIPHLLNDYGP